MFGIGFFLLFKYAGKDAWISVILGTILGVVIMYLYHLIKKYLNNETLKSKLNKSIWGKFFLTILVIFYLYIMMIILILLPMFVNSFYLLYTPKILIVVPFVLISLYLSQKSKNTLTNLSSLLFVISIFTIIIFYSLLTKYNDINNLLPIFSTKTKSILTATFIYASITSIPNIALINYPNNTFKDDLKNYLWSSLTNLGITFLTILSLGEPLIKIYSFPEYDVLKQIKIFNFIENIENFSIIVWDIDLFITFTVMATNLKETLPKKYNKVYFYLLIFITLFIATFIIGENYKIIYAVFFSYAYVLYGFLLIFLLLLLYLKSHYKKGK